MIPEGRSPQGIVGFVTRNTRDNHKGKMAHK